MNTKKSSKRKRKLGSLLLLLFLTVILLATSTYAWFTSNRSVTIDDIDVTVSTASGIQISTDANSWKALISNSDITTGYSFDAGTASELIDTNMFNTGNLVPVSTAGVVTDGKLVMYKGVIDDKNDDGVLGLTASVSPEARSTSVGDFIAFDIFLKLDQAGTVYLSPGSGAVMTNSSATNKGAQYAARMGFVVEGNGASTLPAKTLAGYNSGNSVLIVEPNYDAHIQYGIEQARLYYQDYTYGDTAGATYEDLQVGSGNDYVTWDGLSGTIADSAEIPWAQTNATDNSTKFVTMNGNNLTRTNEAFATSTTGTPVDIGLALSAGVTKIRVYLWMEGQDIDCDTYASGSNITFRIGFTLDAS